MRNLEQDIWMSPHDISGAINEPITEPPKENHVVVHIHQTEEEKQAMSQEVQQRSDDYARIQSQFLGFISCIDRSGQQSTLESIRGIGSGLAALKYLEHEKVTAQDADMVSRICATKIGTMMYTDSEIDQIEKVLKKARSVERGREYIDHNRFDSSPELYIRFGELTLKDVLKTKPHSIAPADFYTFLHETYVIMNEHDSTLHEPTEFEELCDRYPLRYSHAVLEASTITQSLLFFPSDAQPQLTTLGNGMGRKIHENTAGAIKQFCVLRQNMSRLLLNPDRPGFGDLVARVDSYKTSDSSYSPYEMLLPDQGLHKLYRFAKTYVEEGGQYSSFYQELVDYIEPIFQLAESDKRGFMSVEDAIMLIDTQFITDETEIISFEDVAKRARQVRSQTSEQIICINPNEIAWGALVPASEVELRLDKKDPKRFGMKFTYNDENGDTLFFGVFNDDLYQHDWSFYDRPKDYQYVSDILLRVTDSALQVLQKQRAEELDKRRKVGAHTTKNGGNDKKIHNGVRNTGEVEGFRKNKSRNGLSDVTIDQSEEIQQAESGKDIRTSIILPDNEEIGKILRSLNYIDQQRVLEYLETVNTTGVANPVKLAYQGNRGNSDPDLSKLRISSKVPGGIRILLEKESGSDGDRKYRLVAVDYRKDIYRKNNL